MTHLEVVLGGGREREQTQLELIQILLVIREAPGPVLRETRTRDGEETRHCCWRDRKSLLVPFTRPRGLKWLTSSQCCVASPPPASRTRKWNTPIARHRCAERAGFPLNASQKQTRLSSRESATRRVHRFAPQHFISDELPSCQPSNFLYYRGGGGAANQ